MTSHEPSRPSETEWLHVVQERLQSRPEKLEVLYNQNMEWARHFNGLIWTISSILLPISFAGFAVNFREDTGSINKEALTFVAIASVLLLLFWGLLSSWHRRLWERAFTLTGMIEKIWGYHDQNDACTAKTLCRHILADLTPRDKGAWIRWSIVYLGMALWLVRIYIVWATA
jgi:hypothetical protein